MSDEFKPDIWHLQDQFDIDGLIKALTSEDENIRRRAAAALRKMNAVSALPALREAFKQEKDPQTRHSLAACIEALSVLERQPDKSEAPKSPTSSSERVNRLIALLKSDNIEEVVKASQQLGDMGEKIAVEALVLVFNDTAKSIQVRLAVAEALIKLESAPVEVALLANLRHQDWHIRRNGAAILGQLKAEWAVEPLAVALHDPHPIVRRTARAALKHIGTPDSRKALAMASPMMNSPLPPSTNTTPAGEQIKRVGQGRDSSGSGMLSKHLQLARKKIGNTEPLNPDIVESHEKKTRPDLPTVQIDQAVLDELEDFMNQDDDKTNPS